MKVIIEKKTGALLLMFLLFLQISVISCKKKNPYVYDMSEYKKVSSELIRYREIRQIPTGMDSPEALTTTPGGRLYLAGEKKMVILNNTGKLIKTVPLEGKTSSITSDEERIYIGMEDHIQVFDYDGEQLDIWSSLGERAILTSLSTNHKNLFAADAGNHMVVVYSKEGQVMSTIMGSDSYGFIIPGPYFDIAAAGDFFWIVNPGRHRLEKYSTEGNLIAHFGSPGAAIENFSGCCNPTHILLLPDGSFVTAEKGLTRIKKLKPGGTLKYVIAAPDLFIQGTIIKDIAMDGEGDLYVIDSINKTIRIFQEVREE